MATRVFRLCAATEQAAFEGRTSELLRAWAGEWVGAAPELRVTSEAADPADGAGGGEWLHCEGPNGSVWVAAEQARSVASSLLGGSAEGSLSAAVGEDALVSLVKQLAAGDTVRILASPSHLFEPGRATLCVSIDVGAKLVLFVELPPGARRDTQTLGPLAASTAALRRQTVAIDVWLGEAELELGTLRTLAVGDVLRLDKKLDQGAELRLNDERLPCVGYLGALDGRVAIEVARR